VVARHTVKVTDTRLRKEEKLTAQLDSC